MSRRRDPELKLARNAKIAGISKREYLDRRSDAMRRSANAQGWQPSVLAMTLADLARIADKVYGKHDQAGAVLSGKKP